MTAEAAPPSFVMQGSREVLDSTTLHIERQVVALETAVASNAGLVFDLAKTLLESVCKTILSERKYGHGDGWDLPKLLKETLGQLRLVPDGIDGDREVSDSLRKIAGGLQTTIQGICELRNSHGFASHGKEAAFRQLESVQALLAARSSDAIVNFLFRAHRGHIGGRATPQLAYADHPTFNDYVDEAHDVVRIFEEEFEPSRILFDLAPEPYRVYLTEFMSEQEGARDADGEAAQ